MLPFLYGEAIAHARRHAACAPRRRDRAWLARRAGVFVLSRFVLAYTIGEREMGPWGVARFALRRQLRLDPPYWASIALVVGYAWYERWRYGPSRPLPGAGVIAANALYLHEIARLGGLFVRRSPNARSCCEGSRGEGCVAPGVTGGGLPNLACRETSGGGSYPPTPARSKERSRRARAGSASSSWITTSSCR